jgi:hypothetical protein
MDFEAKLEERVVLPISEGEEYAEDKIAPPKKQAVEDVDEIKAVEHDQSVWEQLDEIMDADEKDYAEDKIAQPKKQAAEDVDEIKAVEHDQSVWEQLDQIMDAVESVISDLEFGPSRIIALFAIHIGFDWSFNNKELKFKGYCYRVDGTNLYHDATAAIANFAVMRDGRPIRIRWKINNKGDEMWIGFTADRSYLSNVNMNGTRCTAGNISYYGGREGKIGTKTLISVKTPVLSRGLYDSGYGSLHIPTMAKHILQPYSKGDEIELELYLGIGNENRDWISLYHNGKPQLIKDEIESVTKNFIKLFPYVVIDRPEDDVEYQLVL